MSTGISGGDKFSKVIAQIGDRVGRGGLLKVGFIDGATHPADAKAKNSKPIKYAQIGFWLEYGVLGKKKGWKIPPRPYFRMTIADKSPNWGKDLATLLSSQKLESQVALEFMGIRIKEQLQATMRAWPADNAPSTAKRKGFNKGLLDTGKLIQIGPSYEVIDEPS